MCEFCHKHGEGKTWYLRAENYAEDLLSDVRRRRFLAEFVSERELLKADLKNLESWTTRLLFPGRNCLGPLDSAEACSLRAGGAHRGC